MTNNINHPNLITRREVIFRVSAMLGGAALIGQSAMLAGCEKQTAINDQTRPENSPFTQADIELLDEIADTILPETDTPGAKAAGVGPFIAMMVTDTYHTDDQRIFRDGLQSLQADCMEMHGAGFAEATPGQRLLLLEKLDATQHEHMQSRADGAPAHHFRMLKELTLLGYFTSEIGCTQAQRYVESPGRFDPCLPYTPGEKNWANHA